MVRQADGQIDGNAMAKTALARKNCSGSLGLAIPPSRLFDNGAGFTDTNIPLHLGLA